MIKTIDAIFDGIVLRPGEPLSIEPNTQVRITIETILPEEETVASFLDTALSLNLEGPPDWSENIEKLPLYMEA